MRRCFLFLPTTFTESLAFLSGHQAAERPPCKMGQRGLAVFTTMRWQSSTIPPATNGKNQNDGSKQKKKNEVQEEEEEDMACVSCSTLRSAIGTMGGEEFTTMFNSRPVAERAAAMMMSRRYPHRGVVLKTFVEQLPKLSRDDIFQRGVRVEEWVRESALLHLVEEGSGICRVTLTADAKFFLLDDAPSEMAEKAETQQQQQQQPPGMGCNHGSTNERLLNFVRHNVLGTREVDVPNYKAISEAYSSLLREASANAELRGLVNTLKYAEFLSILHSPQGKEAFWVNEKYVCTRLSGETRPPRFVSPQPQTMFAHAQNAYGGWGAASNVPTRQDVYEVLKYVPIGWGNFGSLNIPVTVKKKHIRIASTLQWFRRQPFYFELRNVAGTTEIRRSIVLHPEVHGLSPEEAHERLQLKIAKGEANSLAPLTTDGELVATSGASQHVAALLKFVARVCPGYFAPPSLLMQRYTKKNLSQIELVACAKGHHEQFEVLQSKYTDVPLLRKRIGADSVRWKGSFVEDLERHPEDVRGLIILMGRVCSTWDRPHYVYVRLTEEEKLTVGGFNGMLQILRRHPQVFRVGDNFIARVDLSDPLSLCEPEPLPGDMASRVCIREENPYQTPRELAVVFHYVAPEDEPCTASFFLQCASPAMRAVLPPRIVTVLQLFPDLFVCKETSPGVFSMRKVKRAGHHASSVVFDGAAERQGLRGVLSLSTSSDILQGGTDSAAREKSLDVEEIFEEADSLSREEVVGAVKALVPPGGVEASRLLLWASIGVQQAANRYYGGVLKLVETNRAHFRIQESQETRMIYLAEEFKG